MTSKDLLYLAMFYVLKHHSNKDLYLFDMYELVIDVCDNSRFYLGDDKFKCCIDMLRTRCLPMRCAKTVLSFCKFAEKFANICK